MVAFGRDIALYASRLDREQTSKGLRLGENDTWQAAVALQFDLTLVTNDTDFEKVGAVKRRDYLREE